MARGYISPYRTYVFKTKDPVIDKLRTVVDVKGSSYAEISEASGVSTTTLYNWFNGATRRPQFATVNAVAMALGKEFALVKRRH